MPFIHPGGDRQQLHHGHTEPPQMGDGGGVGQAGEGAALGLGDIRVKRGEASPTWSS